MKKPTIMCKEMHLHDIILGLMQPLGREIHIVLDIFLNQQPLGLYLGGISQQSKNRS
jgi:hypothetical protein